MVASPVQQRLWMVLRRYCGERQQELIPAALETIVAYCRRALDERKCEDDLNKAGLPGNRAVLYTTLAYAQSMQGRPLDRELCRLAALDEGGEAKTPYEKSTSEDHMVHAARLALLARDAELAQKSLSIRKRPVYRAEEIQLLRDLIEHLERGLPLKDSELERRWLDYFERIRPVSVTRIADNGALDPLTRFEWAILHQLYFQARAEPDWQSVCLDVAR